MFSPTLTEYYHSIYLLALFSLIYRVSVQTVNDVIRVITWVDRGLLQVVQRKPFNDEKKILARAGYVYVYPAGLGRWRDGENWQDGLMSKTGLQARIVRYQQQPPGLLRKFTATSGQWRVISYQSEKDGLPSAESLMLPPNLMTSEKIDSNLIHFASGMVCPAHADHTTNDPPASSSVTPNSALSDPPVDLTADDVWESSSLLSPVSTDYSPSYSSLQYAHFSEPFFPLWDEATEPNYLHGIGELRGRDGIDASPSSSKELLPFAVLQCTKSRKGILSAIMQDGQLEHFESFCLCFHAEDIPKVIVDTFLSYQTMFASRLMAVDSSSSRCFGATETFVVDYQGEAKLMGCLAVVLPELDSQTVSDAMSANSGHFIIDFVLLHSTTRWATAPSTWLETQLLGSHFPTERQKRAAWALGQLPPTFYHPDSTTFKCIYQYWTSESLNSSSRPVVHLYTPSSTLSPLVNLKLCLYHPANASLASSLVSVLDQPLRDACQDCVEEWLIAVLDVRRCPPKGLNSTELLREYFNYMKELIDLQLTSFKKAGYTQDVLHSCAYMICPHNKPSFRKLQTYLWHAVEKLERLVNSTAISAHTSDYYAPPPILREHARDLGLWLYWYQSSYILLQPHERELHDSHCRSRLNEMRARLSERVFPAPALIWNYLPYSLQHKLREYRQSMER